MTATVLAKKIEIWPVDRLKPYEGNARTHADGQVDKIVRSITEFGFTNPILVDSAEGIIAGHGRLMAAKRMGLSEVPVVILDHLSDAQRRAYILADNRLALDAGWDDAILAAEIAALNADGFDLELTGFSDDELADLLEDVEQVEAQSDEDATPEVPAEPVTRMGDVWVLGKHRVMCGDSTSIDAAEQLVQGLKADMVFTDPPYGIDYSGGRTQVVATKTYGKLKNDDLQGDDLGNLIANVFVLTKPEADVYICVSPIMQKPFLDFVHSNGKNLNAVIVWDKKNAGLGYMAYRRQCEFILFVKGGPFKKGDPSDFDLWTIGRDGGQTYVHGTQKPVEVPARAIQNSSKKGDLVLDFFGGSGSTLIACEKTGRINRSMELDPKYCDVIVKRWQEFTGKKATLEATGESFDDLTPARD